MTRAWKRRGILAGLALAGATVWIAGARNPSNAVEPNPHAANPCAAGNPCAGDADNPCSGRAMANPCNPCAGSANPCNPCAGAARVDPNRFQQPAGVQVARSEDLLARGAELWNDGSLSSNGAACSTCHVEHYAQMQPSFASPYPHRVAMVQQLSGVAQVNAAEMVQFCMLQPMQAEPLAWSSVELAALAAYVEHIRPGYRPVAAPPANPCNPCGMAANPCGVKANPCNPCAGR